MQYLDGDDRHARDENRLLVLQGLGGEELPGRHRDDAHLLVSELLSGLDGNGDLRSGGDEDDVGLALRVNHRVGALERALDGAVLQRGQVLREETSLGLGHMRVTQALGKG